MLGFMVGLFWSRRNWFMGSVYISEKILETL
jgi:hypothetical protein